MSIQYNLKTTIRSGKMQILSVCIFLPITISATIAMFFQLLNNNDYWALILIFFFIAYLKFLIDIIIHWFDLFYTIEMDDYKIIGYNLFKKKRELCFNNIVKIGRHRAFFSKGANHVAIWDKANKVYSITSDIDHFGFIHDLILERVDKDIIDEKWIKKMRNNSNLWRYTRRTPFNTEYEKEYLDWLHDEAQNKLQEMIENGILKSGVLYGDDVGDVFHKVEK